MGLRRAVINEMHCGSNTAETREVLTAADAAPTKERLSQASNPNNLVHARNDDDRPADRPNPEGGRVSACRKVNDREDCEYDPNDDDDGLHQDEVLRVSRCSHGGLA